jgi:uncharacterized membrane protein YgcG
VGESQGATRPVRGICCSGGGIRSAAFSLGALQELSRQGRLEGRSADHPDRTGAQFLAGVSGGSYIASAFTLANRFSVRSGADAPPIFAEGTPEETFLRNRCSYLAAGVGGKLRLVATVITNFLANLLFFAMLLWVPGRLLGWLYAESYPGLAGGGCDGCDPFLPVDGPVATLLQVTAAALAAALLVIVVRRMITSAPAWHLFETRLSSTVLVAASVVVVGLFVLPQLLALGRFAATEPVAVVGPGASNPEVATGVALTAALSAAISQVAVNLRNARSLERHVTTASKWYSSLGERVQRLVVFVAGALLGPLAILLGLLLIVHSAANDLSLGTQLSYVLGGLLSVALLYRFADLTAWSLHPFYKRRLASAFAVQRVLTPDGRPRARQIDYADPLLLSACSPEAIQDEAGYEFPELIVCAAANVSDGGETPPGSAVTSFAFTPHEVGGELIGRMDTREYEKLVTGSGDAARGGGGGGGLGGGGGPSPPPPAVAISGAAIAPSMGKMTRGSLRFLLALANMRLGVWLPNLRRRADFVEDSKTRRAIARAVPRPHNLLKEVAGRHRLNGRFLYVTDGGHYENLGIVELLQRGCTEIYCFDASGDPAGSFASLGEAIALARTDAGVEIDIEPEEMLPKKAGDGGGETTEMVHASQQYVIGSFSRDGRKVGTIVYVRAAVTPDVPWDVRAYAKKDKAFPANPTTSQLYTGERFEAYRMLGVHGTRAAIAEMDRRSTSTQVGPSDGPPSDDTAASAAGAAAAEASLGSDRDEAATAPARQRRWHRGGRAVRRRSRHRGSTRYRRPRNVVRRR